LRDYVDKRFAEQKFSAGPKGDFFSSLGEGIVDVGKGAGKFLNKVLDKGIGLVEKVINKGSEIINHGIDAAQNVATSAIDALTLPLAIGAGAIGLGIVLFLGLKMMQANQQSNAYQAPSVSYDPQNQRATIQSLIAPTQIYNITQNAPWIAAKYFRHPPVIINTFAIILFTIVVITESRYKQLTR